jgi:transposase
MTMPGLDYFAASLILAEICDVNRFGSDKKLVGWAGLAPRVHQSGGRTVYGGLAGAGTGLFVGFLVEAAQAAIRSDERFKLFYQCWSACKGCKKAFWPFLMRCFV